MDLDVSACLSDIDAFPSLREFPVIADLPDVNHHAQYDLLPLPPLGSSFVTDAFEIGAETMTLSLPASETRLGMLIPSNTEQNVQLSKLSKVTQDDSGTLSQSDDDQSPHQSSMSLDSSQVQSTSKHTQPHKPALPAATSNVSHTRRCRAKVNSKLQELLSILPQPDQSLEVKHKAQILRHAIHSFRTIRSHNVRLEMRIAMSSPAHMRRWVRSVVEVAPNTTEALKSFMALICLTRQWKYAELWAPVMPENGCTPLLKYVTGALPLDISDNERRRLRAYRARSKCFRFQPRSGVPGRVYLTMRPEWLPLLADVVAFPRAPYAIEHKVEVTFAVPVIVSGAVVMVVEFYDTKKREYDPQVVNIANEIAGMFGRAFDAQIPAAQLAQTSCV